MVEIENLTKAQLERVDEFVRTAFYLEEDELKALDEQIPMTQELFDRLSDRLFKIGAQNDFLRLLKEYPDFTKNSVDKIEKELELKSMDIPEMTEEETQQSFERLMERISSLTI